MTAKTKSYPIEPLFDNVLIEPLDEYEAKLPSGLYTVDPKVGEKPLVGIIRGVSTRKYLDKDKVIEPRPIVKVGDKVLYRKWSMSEIKYEGKELIIVRQQDIAAIINF